MSCAHRPLLLLGLTLASLLGTGCRHSLPAASFVIRDVEVSSDVDVPIEPLLAGLATAESRRFLGLWDGVAFEYEVLDENLLARDLERVERYFRARGYYEAKVRAARVVHLPQPRRVRVEIAVDAGAPVRVRRVRTPGLERLPPPELAGGRTLAADVVEELRFRDCELAPDGHTCLTGDVFDEQVFEETQQAIRDVLGDRGYACVAVDAHADVDLAAHVADVSFEVDAGPPATIGAIVVEGLQKIPESKVRAQLGLEVGGEYSRRRLREAENTLTALGRFSNVDIALEPTVCETVDAARRLSREARQRGEPTAPPSSEPVQVTIRVELTEAALRGVRAGVGARFDVLKLSTHVLGGWDSQNFLGGMRSLRVEDRVGLTYYPLRIGLFEGPVKILPENYFRTTLRQPSFIERRTDGILRADVNAYPVLYRLPEGVDPSLERIIGYLELRTSTGLERRFFDRKLTLQPSYSLSENIPYMYQGKVPDGLDRVLVIYPELFLDLDLRDDPIAPRRGFRLSSSFQVAGPLGEGDVEDLKLQPDARFYWPMSKHVVLAVRGSVGFLFPRNYGDSLDPTKQGALDPASAPVIRDQAKLLFRVFYSGGPNSNRGYPYRGVGPHGPLGFLQPTSVQCEFNPPPDEPNPAVCNRPLGGLSIWESSMELRFPVWGALGAVLFVDGSDVTRQAAYLRATSPHLSPGLGLRYVTPVGPVRVDAGYRALRTLGEETELAGEPDPGDLLGIPIALHISLGEAF